MSEENAIYKVIGVMSGTSLDGIDVALCRFEFLEHSWRFEIEKSTTYDYNAGMQKKLRDSYLASARELAEIHAIYGQHIGELVKSFCEDLADEITLVASHGYTVFHEPEKNYTCQIGSGAHIAASCGLPVVCDFRSLDVAHGGQGAPLVPIGDKLLFGEYAACINIGGFANVSFDVNNERLAYDICPTNIVLNKLALTLGHEFDENGLLSSKGEVNKLVLDKLNKLQFYKQQGPKSLGNEWVERCIWPILENEDCTENKLRTFVEHIAEQIARSLNNISGTNFLFTGGGVFNSFLMKRISDKLTNKQLVVPDFELINNKEALIFAFLGLLRWRQNVNTLSSVTGAKNDSTGGCIYLP